MQRPGDLAGDDDLIFAQAALQGELGGFHGGEDHALVDDLFGGEAEIAVGILLHLAHDQFLIERAAIDADAHGLAVIAGDSADRGELFVAALAGADVAGIDAVLVESASAVGIFGQQDVAVVVEIADERSFAAGVEHALLDFGDSGGGFGNFTVMRTISEPAVASSMHCCTVEATSAVSVLVMDWMTMGAPPPTVTRPTFTVWVCSLCVTDSAPRNCYSRLFGLRGEIISRMESGRRVLPLGKPASPSDSTL